MKHEIDISNVLTIVGSFTLIALGIIYAVPAITAIIITAIVAVTLCSLLLIKKNKFKSMSEVVHKSVGGVS